MTAYGSACLLLMIEQLMAQLVCYYMLGQLMAYYIDTNFSLVSVLCILFTFLFFDLVGCFTIVVFVSSHIDGSDISLFDDTSLLSVIGIFFLQLFECLARERKSSGSYFFCYFVI
jgi:hypothetical protein